MPRWVALLLPGVHPNHDAEEREYQNQLAMREQAAKAIMHLAEEVSQAARRARGE